MNTFQNIRPGSVPIYPTFAQLPATAQVGDTAIAANTLDLYIFTGTFWEILASGGGGGGPTGPAGGDLGGTYPNPTVVSVADVTTGILKIANGGTGAATQQAAINALAGSVTNAEFLRGNGTNVVMASISASDVPTLNQNTTGTAANITATSNSTLTTLSALSLPYSQVTGTPTPLIFSDSLINTSGTVTLKNDSASPTATQYYGTNGSSVLGYYNLPPPGTGTVTSVALALPVSVFGISGSPVTTSGTLTGSFNTQSANTVFAGPTSGGSATPAFRTLVSADIPNNAANTTGTASNITATSNSTLTSLPNLAISGSQVSGGTFGVVNGSNLTNLPAASITGVLPIANGGTGNTAGTAVNISATSNSTLTTLSSLSLPGAQVTGNISGNAANVTGTVAIANGGTGQTTANAAFNALSPMTTLGDIIYENATPIAARLAGNTTTTKMHLSQTGNGTISSAPVWAQTAFADLSGTASLTTQVSGILPIANGGTGQSTQQAAINALTGTQTSGTYLRSDGTNATLSSIQAGDVPTLNQNTTGTAANVTGVVAVANGGTGVTSLPGTFVLNGGQAGAVTLGPSNANSLTLNSNGSARMTFLSTGFVGIGTTGPIHTLDVAGANARLFVTSTTGTNGVLLKTVNGSGAAYVGVETSVGGTIASGSTAYAALVGTDVFNPLQLTTAGIVRMTILATGGVGIGNTNPTYLLDVLGGSIGVGTAGQGYVTKEGSNAKQGTATLSAGTVTVANTSVTANSRIFLTAQSLGTIAIPSALAVTARTAGTSFTITSAAITDTSVVAYEIFEPY